MAPRVNLDVVPALARPPEVEAALREAVELRDRARRGKEELAAAEAELAHAEEADVAATAERLRAGGSLGEVTAAVKSTRDAFETAKRNAAALELASQGAEADLAKAMHRSSEAWFAALELEAEQARQRGLASVAALEAASRALGAAAGAAVWVGGAYGDSRWDRIPETMPASAPSSARATADRQALDVGALVAYARELFEPLEAPTPPPPGKAAGTVEKVAAD